MDDRRFDALVRALQDRTGSRRRALTALLVALGVPGVAARETGADRGKGKGKGGTGKQGKQHRSKGKGKKAEAQPTVTLCHNGQTLAVAQAALTGHLKHGDTLGPCGAPTPGPEACAGIVDGPAPSGQCSWCCQEVCCLPPQAVPSV